MAGVVVRPVQPTEYDAVGALTADAFAVDGFAGGGYLDLLRDVESRVAVAEVLVAVEGDDVLGTVTLVGPDAPPDWRETSRPDVGTVRMLGVAPTARGRGVGLALAQACVDRAVAAGWRELTLLTQPTMHAAQRIYARLGFQRDASLDLPVSATLTLLGFRLPLR